MEFENEDDRAYYINKDSAHLSFVQSAGPLLQNIRVVDFQPGKY